MKTLSGISAFLCVVGLFISSTLFAQKTIAPKDPSINVSFFKNQNSFHKLSWLDNNGTILKEATLNLITKIDTINNKMVYLQIRNDGKKDSSICEYPSLKPIYVLSTWKNGLTYYDYRAGKKIKVHMEANSKTTYDTVFNMPNDYFDGFISEYILGALPLEKLEPMQFDIYRGDIKKNGTIKIIKISKDIFQSANGAYLPIFVLSITSANADWLVYIDARSHKVLKTVFPLPDGGYFVKASI